jgi:hypothetical protein
MFAPEYFFPPHCPVIDYAASASAENNTRQLQKYLKPACREPKRIIRFHRKFVLGAV